MGRKTAVMKAAEKAGEEAKLRIMGYLKDGHVLQASDLELINLYAETYQFYFRLQKEISIQKLLIEYTNKAGAKNLIKNPLAIELTKTVQVLNNLLRSLGLTPAQRREFADAGFVPKGGDDEDEPERDDFEKF